MTKTWLEGKLASSNDPALPTVPTRAIDTEFVASPTGWVMGSYTVEITITTGQDLTVSLLCDAADPPTVSRGSARTNVIGIQRFQLTGLFPPGFNVKLAKSGTGAASIVAQTEDVVS